MYRLQECCSAQREPDWPHTQPFFCEFLVCLQTVLKPLHPRVLCKRRDWAVWLALALNTSTVRKRLSSSFESTAHSYKHYRHLPTEGTGTFYVNRRRIISETHRDRLHLNEITYQRDTPRPASFKRSYWQTVLLEVEEGKHSLALIKAVKSCNCGGR